MRYSEIKNMLALDVYYGAGNMVGKMLVKKGTLAQVVGGEDEYEESYFAEIELENGVGETEEASDSFYVLADSEEKLIERALELYSFDTAEQKLAFAEALRSNEGGFEFNY